MAIQTSPNAQPRIRPVERDAQNSQRVLGTNRSPNLGQTTKPSNNQHKTDNCRNFCFAVPADYRVKLKESEMGAKYLDLAKELNNYGT